MTIAAPILYVAGGLFLGLSLSGFGRHHILGWLSILAGITLVIFAVTNTTLTIPRPVIHYPPAPTRSIGSAATAAPR